MNFDPEFKKFHGRVKLDSSKKKILLGSKDALRGKIKADFRSKNRTPVPNFYMQGSFAMCSTINPSRKEYDLDDGVYLNNIDTSKPVTEWESPETVHRWIVSAVDGHTSKIPQDKNLCVRVLYADENKHVDLPIYAEKDGEYYLAVKNKGWMESDPKEINDWFANEVRNKSEQYRRVVRYLKAWKDHREDENGTVQLFGGFQLTVLAAKHFISDSESDEESFFRTVKSISNSIWSYRNKVPHPVRSGKNIIEHYSDKRKVLFQDEFNNMFDKAKKAYYEKDCEEKAKKWVKIFGDRFPIPNESECGKKKSKETPATITGTTDISKTSGRQA